MTSAKESVLSFGLSFCPTAYFNFFTTVKDIFLFARRLLLKKRFSRDNSHRHLLTTPEELEVLGALESLLQEQEVSDPKFPEFARPRSTTFPPLTLSPTVEMFVRLSVDKLRDLPARHGYDNLTGAQRLAIRQLKEMHNIVIKPSDKGGNVVIWPSVMYETEARRQLHNTECYRRLDSNPTKCFSGKLEKILVQVLHSNIITQSVYDNFRVKYPVAPTMYFLPKIHKDLITPLRRPIVSGCGSLCKTTCRFLDHYLKPCVESLPSYVHLRF